MALRSGSRNLNGILETCNRLGWISTGCEATTAGAATCWAVVFKIGCATEAEAIWDGVSVTIVEVVVFAFAVDDKLF